MLLSAKYPKAVKNIGVRLMPYDLHLHDMCRMAMLRSAKYADTAGTGLRDQVVQDAWEEVYTGSLTFMARASRVFSLTEEPPRARFLPNTNIHPSRHSLFVGVGKLIVLTATWGIPLPFQLSRVVLLSLLSGTDMAAQQLQAEDLLEFSPQMYQAMAGMLQIAHDWHDALAHANGNTNDNAVAAAHQRFVDSLDGFDTAGYGGSHEPDQSLALASYIVW